MTNGFQFTMIGIKSHILTAKVPWSILNFNFKEKLQDYIVEFHEKNQSKSFYIIEILNLQILNHYINNNTEFVVTCQITSKVFEPKHGDVLSMTVLDIDKKNNFTICQLHENEPKSFKVFLKDCQMEIGEILNVEIVLVKNRKYDLIAIGKKI